DSGRRLAVVGRLFVGVSVLDELGLIPGAREHLQTSGQALDIAIRYGDCRPLRHATEKGGDYAQVSGDGMGGRVGGVGNLGGAGNLGVAVTVNGWELRPGWKDQRIDSGGVHSLHESRAETGLVLAALDGRRIVLGGQSLHRFVEALLVQRVEELGGSNVLHGRV